MTNRTIKRHLKILRAECIDGETDIIVKRIAYEMGTAIRRVTERVVGWPSLSQQAHDAACLLRRELETDHGTAPAPPNKEKDHD